MNPRELERLRNAQRAGKLGQDVAAMGRSASSAASEAERLARALADPATRQAVANTVNLTRETQKLNDATRARVDLEARRAAVANGQYARDLAAARQIAREQQRIHEMERKAEFQFRYGNRLGGLAHAADRWSRSRIGGMMLTGAAAAGATVGGMASSGFRGTVEGNRLELELTRISRELAGAFLPVVQGVTKALGVLRRTLEQLGPGGQNAVMAGGLALGAYGTYRILGGAARMLGIGGAAAAGGGAAAGGAAAGGAGAAGAAAVGAGAAARGVAGRAAGFAARAFLPAAVALGVYESVSESGVAGLNPFGSPGIAGMAKGGGPNPARRQVTIADSGFESPGAAFERMTNKLNLVEAENPGAALGAAWAQAKIDEAVRLLAMIAAGDKGAMLGRPY